MTPKQRRLKKSVQADELPELGEVVLDREFDEPGSDEEFAQWRWPEREADERA